MLYNWTPDKTQSICNAMQRLMAPEDRRLPPCQNSQFNTLVLLSILIARHLLISELELMLHGWNGIKSLEYCTIWKYLTFILYRIIFIILHRIKVNMMCSFMGMTRLGHTQIDHVRRQMWVAAVVNKIIQESCVVWLF